MPTRVLLFTVFLTALAGCSAEGVATSTIKPTGGGSVRIDGVARVDVPPRTFDRPTKVSLRRADRPDALHAFGGSAVVYEVKGALPYEYQITAAGAGRPKVSVEVTIQLPAKWRKAATELDAHVEGTTVRAFGRNVWTGGGDGSLVTMEPILGTFDERTDTLHLFVPAHVFADAGNDDASAAVIRLGLVPEVAAGAAPVTHWTTKGLAEAPRDEKGRRVAPTVYLGPPLRGEYRATTTFGLQPSAIDGVERFHPGVNYAPDSAVGGDVLAMADGTVVAAGEPLAHDDADVGWGPCVILAHGRGGAAGPYTVYSGFENGAAVARVGERVTRGDVIARMAKATDGEASSPRRELHVEFVSGGISPATLAKADPASRAAPVLVDRLVAGARSTAMVIAPDVDADHQSAEARGTAAENGSWLFATTAKAGSSPGDSGLAYRAGASGDAVTVLTDAGLRVVFEGSQSAVVTAKPIRQSHPRGANAAGSMGGRLRFRTVAPATYRLRLSYSAPDDAGHWEVNARLNAASADGPGKPVNDTLKSASGEGEAKVDQTYEGRLDGRTTYDFEFLPSVSHTGGEGQESLVARAILEVTPVTGEQR